MKTRLEVEIVSDLTDDIHEEPSVSCRLYVGQEHFDLEVCEMTYDEGEIKGLIERSDRRANHLGLDLVVNKNVQELLDSL